MQITFTSVTRCAGGNHLHISAEIDGAQHDIQFQAVGVSSTELRDGAMQTSDVNARSAILLIQLTAGMYKPESDAELETALALGQAWEV